MRMMNNRPPFYILFSILLILMTGCAPLGSPTSSPESASTSNTPAVSETLSASYYYLESRIHIKDKEYQKAIISLENALGKDPGSIEIMRDLIRLYLRQKNETKALALSESMIKDYPNNVDGLLLFVQLKKDKIDDAQLKEILNRVLKLDPDNKETFLRLGKIYMEEEKLPEALDLFQQMVKRFPDYYVAWFYLGEAYFNHEKYDLAKTQFNKSIELEPDLVEPRFQLIEIYSRIKSNDSQKKIFDTYNEILEIEKENLRAQLGLALYYFKHKNAEKTDQFFSKLGKKVESNSRFSMVIYDEYISKKKFEDALILLTQLLKITPGNSTLNFFAGLAYEAIEDYDTAISYYSEIKADHPQYKKSILSIAFLYKEIGKENIAIEYLEGKHKELPKDIDIITYLASFYENDKKYEAAMALLKEALKGSSDNTSLLFRLGAVQDKAGLNTDSINTMKKILEIDPKDASALNYIGYTYADQGIKLDEALDLIKKANEIKPGDGYITDSLGWVYFKKGDFQNAILHLKNAAEITNYETIISDHLGDAYLENNQLKDALETYKKAIANAKESDADKVIEINEKIKVVQKKINE